jgi:hypothetical protein
MSSASPPPAILQMDLRCFCTLYTYTCLRVHTHNVIHPHSYTQFIDVCIARLLNYWTLDCGTEMVSSTYPRVAARTYCAPTLIPIKYSWSGELARPHCFVCGSRSRSVVRIHPKTWLLRFLFLVLFFSSFYRCTRSDVCSSLT